MEAPLMFKALDILSIGHPFVDQQHHVNVDAVADTITLEEQVNVNKLHELTERIKEVIKDKGYRTRFSNFAKGIDSQGKHLVTYCRKQHGKGRFTPLKGQSVGLQRHELRDALCHGIYHDIDISNAHPTVLLWLCELYNKEREENQPLIKYKCLLLYVTKRDLVLEALHTERSIAKRVVLALTNGQSMKATLKMLKNHPAHKFIPKYKEELDQIAEKLGAKYKDFPTTSQTNKKFSKMSVIMQHWENEVLMCMATYLEQEKGYRRGVLMADGLMVYRKEQGTTAPMPVEVLRQCELHIKERFPGMLVALSEKPITTGIDLS